MRFLKPGIGWRESSSVRMAIQGAWGGSDGWWQRDHIDEGPVGGDRSLQVIRKQAGDYGTHSRLFGNNSPWSHLICTGDRHIGFRAAGDKDVRGKNMDRKESEGNLM